MKKIISIVLTLILTFSLCTMTAFAEVSGDGSANNPYLVSNYDELQEAMNKAAGPNNHIKLTETLNAHLIIEKPLIIDLNGYSAEYIRVYQVNGRVEIRNGIFDEDAMILFYYSNDILWENCIVNLEQYMAIYESNVKIHNVKITGNSSYEVLWCTRSNMEITDSIITSATGGKLFDGTDWTVTIDGVCYTQDTLPDDLQINGNFKENWDEVEKTMKVTHSVTPTYTVTIPATVKLGETATISAENVVVDEGQQVNVKITATSEDDNSFKVTNGKTSKLDYTVTDGGSMTYKLNDTVLSVNPATADNGYSTLTFTAPESFTYAGTYTGNITFTISVDVSK